MRNNRWLYVSLLFSIALIIVARLKVDANNFWGYPPLNTLVVSEYYSQDIGALALGSHRVAGDLAYIQLLQYYGDSGNAFAHKDPKYRHKYSDYLAPVHESVDGTHNHEGHKHDFYETGQFVRLYSLGRRLLRLNPFFSVAVLEIGGSLAFNLKRNKEALDFLREAIELDRSYYRYHLYFAAILYRNEGEDQNLIRVLDKAIEHSDCPPLLENILANLHKKNGNYRRAAEVMIHSIQTSINESDRKFAQKNLVSLIQEQPQLADDIKLLLQE